MREKAGNVKVLVDSNILLQSVKYGIDIKEAIEEALTATCEICVPQAVVKELENKAKHGRFLEKRLAERALELINQRKFTIVQHENLKGIRVDDIVLTLASQGRYILITNDRELRRKARKLHIPVGLLNIEEKRVKIDYLP